MLLITVIIGGFLGTLLARAMIRMENAAEESRNGD